MVLGEMVPKNITIAGPDKAALALGPALAVMVRLLKPFIWFFNTVANGFVRLFGVQPTDEVAASFDETEIRSMVTQSQQEGRLGSEVGDLAAGALTFEHAGLSSVVLELDELVTVPRSTTPRELEATVAEFGVSRYPVRGNDGGLAGYVHVKDVLDVPADRRDDPIPDRDVLPFVELRSDDPLPEVLSTMRRAGAHLGLVRRDGRISGVVALEDVLEQLIGDVRDAAATRRRADEREEQVDVEGGAVTGAGAGGR
jgi:CBS domain containing-hemolysin-like protein